jgi:hypothetical protein
MKGAGHEGNVRKTAPRRGSKILAQPRSVFRHLYERSPKPDNLLKMQPKKADYA